MPRANRRRREQRPVSLERALGGATGLEVHAGMRWYVRRLTGRANGRAYLCPGCQQSFDAALPHVLVWPADATAGIEDRRHWHAGCWQARRRRPPLGSYR